MSDPSASVEAQQELARKLEDDGCIGDDEIGCTRDDARIPFADWCINCLAGHLLTLHASARQQGQQRIEELEQFVQSMAAQTLCTDSRKEKRCDFDSALTCYIHAEPSFEDEIRAARALLVPKA